MKQTYSNKIFNWIILLTTLIFTIYHLIAIFSGFYFISATFDSLFYFALALSAFVSLLSNKMNGEKFSLFYISSFLLIFPISNYITFLIKVFKYGYSTVDFEFSIIHLFFILGIVLTFFSDKFSLKSKNEIWNYRGIFFMIFGAYLQLKIILNYFDFGKMIDLKMLLLEILISAAIIIIGNRIKTNKINFSLGLIFEIFLLFGFYFTWLK